MVDPGCPGASSGPEAHEGKVLSLLPDLQVVGSGAHVVDEIDRVPDEGLEGEEPPGYATGVVDEVPPLRLEPEADAVLLEPEETGTREGDVELLPGGCGQEGEMRVEPSLGLHGEVALDLRHALVAGDVAELDRPIAADVVRRRQPDRTLRVLEDPEGVGASGDVVVEAVAGQDRARASPPPWHQKWPPPPGQQRVTRRQLQPVASCLQIELPQYAGLPSGWAQRPGESPIHEQFNRLRPLNTVALAADRPLRFERCENPASFLASSSRVLARVAEEEARLLPPLPPPPLPPRPFPPQRRRPRSPRPARPLVASKALRTLNVGPGEAILPNQQDRRVGGRMVLDSTFAFLVNDVVVPCNAEHPNCGPPGPQCEDLGEASGRHLSGDYGFYPDLDPGDYEGESSFAIRIPRQGAFTHRGTAEYQVCPRRMTPRRTGRPSTSPPSAAARSRSRSNRSIRT